MPMPKSVTKIKKDGVEFKSSVDKLQYTRAALRDTAKFVRKQVINEMKTLPGLKRSKRPYRAVSYWVRKRESDLQIGFGHNKKGYTGETWYGILQELGSKNQPKRQLLRKAVYSNIPQIIMIQSQYLSALQDEARALRMIDEDEIIGGGDDGE